MQTFEAGDLSRADLRQLEQRLINHAGGVYNEKTGLGNRKLLNQINAQRASIRTRLEIDPDDPDDGFRTTYPEAGCEEPKDTEEEAEARMADEEGGGDGGYELRVTAE